MIEQYTETNSDVVTAKSDNSSRDGDPTLVVAVIDKLTLLALGKWLIAKITGVAVLLGILTTLVLPTRYTAVTKLMAPQQTQPSAAILMNQLTNSAVSSLASAGSGLGLRNPNDIYVGFLTSRTVADPIIEKFGLVRIYRVRDQTAARKKLADNTVVASEKSGF